jgi:dTDP-4-amino-4,6-dideoxygalactose transaminase
METLLAKSEIREFEYQLSEYFDVPYVIATCSASISILGVFYALGIKDSEIITTSLTWPGALTPISILRNRIVFADVEPIHLTIDPDDIENKITKDTMAVFTADFLGYPCRLDEIKKICNKHGVILIHDAASSFGSSYNGYFSGHYADISIFSFEYNKSFNLGEGGCIVTNEKDLYDRLIANLAHPDIQIKKLNELNHFFLKTAINPIAAKYGLENFVLFTERILLQQRKVVAWLVEKGIYFEDLGYSPNFQHIFMKLDEVEKLKYSYEVSTMELPFYPVYWHQKIHSTLEIGTHNCPIAETADSNYKLIKIIK